MNRHVRAPGWIVAALAAVLVVSGCALGSPKLPAPGTSGTAQPAAQASALGGVDTSSPAASFSRIPSVPKPTMPSWFGVALTDVNTGKTFTIQDFAGKVILIDMMATWCPTCQGEMSQVQQVVQDLPASDYVAISLDVDSNEDAALLKKYADQNKFGWRIAVAPVEVRLFLARNYDDQLLNPPLQPMVIIDRAGSVYGLPFGIKSYISLEKTLAYYATL